MAASLAFRQSTRLLFSRRLLALRSDGFGTVLIGHRFLHLPRRNACALHCKLLELSDDIVFNYRIYSTRSPNGDKVDPVFLRAAQFRERLALIDQHGKHTYDDLLCRSAELAKKINSGPDIKGHRIAFLCDNDVSYLITKWAVWMAGAIAVPLCKAHPANQMQYFIEDSQASLVVTTSEYQSVIQPITEQLGTQLKVLSPNDYIGKTDLDEGKMFFESMAGKIQDGDYRTMPALIVYTSGTTGKPKGVVLTHGNLYAQVTGMVEAWGWSKDDVILHVLPLHHVHGIVNVLMTPLHCGATCVMMPKFNAREIWNALLRPVDKVTNTWISLFMAVPTMYALLAEDFQKNPSNSRPEQKALVENVCKNKIRLMVSGSAALPQPIMETWQKITGHTLLERYGMTEIGMGITNSLHGRRVPGAVGNPFPNVEVRISKDNEDSPNGYDIIADGDSKQTTVTAGRELESGELLIRGPNVFKEYWNKTKATKSAFTPDGWFKTGDTAAYEDGVYKIVGRTSVDVIKSGAYKISALEIERHLLAHPDIKDAAVIGLPDVTWGQIIAAVLVLSDGSSLTQKSLSEWCSDKMPPYHIPRVLKILDKMPRNVMGKVNKRELLVQVFPDYR